MVFIIYSIQSSWMFNNFVIIFNDVNCSFVMPIYRYPVWFLKIKNAETFQEVHRKLMLNTILYEEFENHSNKASDSN